MLLILTVMVILDGHQLDQGGGGGLGEYSYIRGNPAIIDETLIIPGFAEDPTYQNSFSKGPVITIQSGHLVTVSEGVTWTIF